MAQTQHGLWNRKTKFNATITDKGILFMGLLLLNMQKICSVTDYVFVSCWPNFLLGKKFLVDSNLSEIKGKS